MYTCAACREDFAQWFGQCPCCHEYGTLEGILALKRGDPRIKELSAQNRLLPAGEKTRFRVVD